MGGIQSNANKDYVSTFSFFVKPNPKKYFSPFWYWMYLVLDLLYFAAKKV